MPALFWLVVVALALVVGVAAAWPWLQERSPQSGPAGTPSPSGDPDAPPARPPWVGPVAMMAVGLVVAVVASFLFPNFPVFVLFLPLIWWQRRRRGPRPPTPGR